MKVVKEIKDIILKKSDKDMNYAVNCYTCQHCQQETCKGCNTLLNGENEPYENWQLREDLEQKDLIIQKLEQENKELRKQLAEKDKEIEKLHKILDSQKRHIDIIEQPFRGHGAKRTGNIILDFELSIRNQVCDEIREKLKAHCDYTDEDNVGWYLTEHKIDLLIDQIKQAKESMK